MPDNTPATLSDASSTRRACLNCGAAFGGMLPKYCPDCGQETNVKPPTLLEFAQQFGGSYIATEGALWRTLKLLLFKPGVLTKEYLAGRRRHYVLPLRLYLTLSVMSLLLVRGLAVVDFGVDDARLKTQVPRMFTMNVGIGQAGLRDGVFFCTGLPEWICHRLQRRFDIDTKLLVREFQALGERFISHLGAAMFLLLPSFALWLRLTYANRQLRYTEHLVFALHVHAFWFVMLGVSLIDVEWLTGAASFAVPLYTLLAMRAVYGGRWWPRLLRASLITALYGVTLAAAMFGIGVWAILA